MDRKSQVVAAGEITHDSVARNFKEIFNARKVLEPLNITDSTQRQVFLTSLFKVHVSALCITCIVLVIS